MFSFLSVTIRKSHPASSISFLCKSFETALPESESLRSNSDLFYLVAFLHQHDLYQQADVVFDIILVTNNSLECQYEYNEKQINHYNEKISVTDFNEKMPPKCFGGHGIIVFFSSSSFLLSNASRTALCSVHWCRVQGLNIFISMFC